MNERFVAVSTVVGSRICGCFSKPRYDFIDIPVGDKPYLSVSHMADKNPALPLCPCQF